MEKDTNYTNLRKSIFKLKPSDIGILLDNDEQVFAAVADMNVTNGVATLVCVFDGTVSLYFSNGAMRMGLGRIESIRQAGCSFLFSSGQCLKEMRIAKEPYDIPPNNMRIYLLTRIGIYVAELKNDKTNPKEISFLNFLVQNVLNKIREATE